MLTSSSHCSCPLSALVKVCVCVCVCVCVSYNNFRWSRMQDQYLEEINEGFINEVLPTDVTLEDSLYHLSGTLDEQYQEWQEILKEFWLLENP